MPETNLGPVVSLASAERIRKQVQDAGTITLYSHDRSLLKCCLVTIVRAGAKPLIPAHLFPQATV